MIFVTAARTSVGHAAVSSHSCACSRFAAFSSYQVFPRNMQAFRHIHMLHECIYTSLFEHGPVVSYATELIMHQGLCSAVQKPMNSLWYCLPKPTGTCKTPYCAEIAMLQVPSTKLWCAEAKHGQIRHKDASKKCIYVAPRRYKCSLQLNMCCRIAREICRPRLRHSS